MKTSRMARLAVTALLALAGAAMFPAGEAQAQVRQPECADNTDASCSVTITTTTADLVANGGSSTFTVNITGYQFGATGRGGAAGEFVLVPITIDGTNQGIPANVNAGVTCTTASQTACSREFETTDFTLTATDSNSDTAMLMFNITVVAAPVDLRPTFGNQTIAEGRPRQRHHTPMERRRERGNAEHCPWLIYGKRRFCQPIPL